MAWQGRITPQPRALPPNSIALCTSGQESTPEAMPEEGSTAPQKVAAIQMLTLPQGIEPSKQLGGDPAVQEFAHDFQDMLVHAGAIVLWGWK